MNQDILLNVGDLIAGQAVSLADLSALSLSLPGRHVWCGLTDSSGTVTTATVLSDVLTVTCDITSPGQSLSFGKAQCWDIEATEILSVPYPEELI